MTNLTGKRVLLIVPGGIAAFKIPELIRLLRGRDCGVTCVLTESGAQFGTYGNFSYDAEAFYHSDPGQRPNEDIQQRQLSLTLKQQFTPQDTRSTRKVACHAEDATHGPRRRRLRGLHYPIRR